MSNIKKLLISILPLIISLPTLGDPLPLLFTCPKQISCTQAGNPNSCKLSSSDGSWAYSGGYNVNDVEATNYPLFAADYYPDSTSSVCIYGPASGTMYLAFNNHTVKAVPTYGQWSFDQSGNGLCGSVYPPNPIDPSLCPFIKD